MHISKRRQRRREQADKRKIDQQSHEQPEAEQRESVSTPDAAPLGIGRMHRQRVVGKGAAIKPGHPEQRQDQTHARHQPERQRQQPTHHKKHRRPAAVPQRGGKTVAPLTLKLTIIGLRNLTQQQG